MPKQRPNHSRRLGRPEVRFETLNKTRSNVFSLQDQAGVAL